MPVEWLDVICRAHDVEGGGRRREREVSLAASLCALDAVDELLDALETDALVLLEWLLGRQGVVPAGEVAARIGEPPAGWLRFEGDGSLGQLRRAGLVFVGLDGEEVVAWVPIELRQVLGIALA